MKTSNIINNPTAKAIGYIKNCGVEVDFGIEEVLDVKEINILSMRSEGKTYREIGKLIGLSHERVRKIAEKAVQKVELHPKMIANAAEQAAIWEAIKRQKENRKIDHSDPSTWRDISVDELKLSTRTYNTIMRAGFFNIVDVTSNLSGVHRTRGVGKTAWIEILDALDAFFGIEYYKKEFAELD